MSVQTPLMPAALSYVLTYPWWWYINRMRWWWTFFQRTWPRIQARATVFSSVTSPTPLMLGFQLFAQAIFATLFGLAMMGLATLWMVWPLSLALGISQGGWSILIGLVGSISAFGLYWWAYVLQPKTTLECIDVDPSRAQLLSTATFYAHQVLKELPAASSSGVILRGLVRDPYLQRYFFHLDVTDQQLLKRAVLLSAKNSQIIHRDQLYQLALEVARHYQHRHVSTVDVFLGLVQASPLINQILEDLDVWNAELDAAVRKTDLEQRQRQAWRWWHEGAQPNASQVLLAELTERQPLVLTESSLEVLKERLQQRLVGQEDAIQQLHSALRRAEHTPTPCLMLVGPCGVGKTEAIRLMTEHFFAHEDALVRIDMADFQHASQAANCLWQLADCLDQGYRTLLLDKMERAHPDAIALIGQAIERGAVLRQDGSVCSLEHNLVVATSNTGATSIRRAVEQGYSPIQIVPAVRALLHQRQFSETWLDQLHGLVVYKHLTLDETQQVVARLIQTLVEPWQALGTEVCVNPEVVKVLGELGYNPRYGARPLDNLVHDKLHPLQTHLSTTQPLPARFEVTPAMIAT
jgi:hypothetical protein